MPAGGRRHGRRDNGLEAAEYAVVGDVDPRIGEHLLDVLGAGGIAAYLQPAADLHPVTRTTILPSRPTDRLFADREHLDTARGYLEQLTAEPDQPDGPGTPNGPDGPGTPDSPAEATGPAEATNGRDPDEPGLVSVDKAEIDAVFASIVAGFHGDDPPKFPTWPAAEDLTDREGAPRRRRTDPKSELEGDPKPAEFEPSLLDALDRLGANLPDEDEGFTPPPPPPLPRLSRTAGFALAAIVCGLVLFLWPELVPFQPNLTLLLGFSGVLGGFITLVWRLRPDDEDNDPEHGARV